MKTFTFFLGLNLSVSLAYGQKSATLLIDSDHSSLPLINSVHIQKNDKSFQTRFFNIKNILMKDLDSGRYQVKYITYFFDTISESVDINKYEKIRISYPEKNFYQPTDNLDSLVEFFLMSDVAELRLYIKSNIFDYTFYHQAMRIKKSQDNYKGYFTSYNYGPDTRKGLGDTAVYLDLSGKYIKALIEFFYSNQDANNPNAFVQCNHFGEAYLMANRRYFYFNFCEDGKGEVFNLVNEF